MTQKGFTLWFTGLPCSGKTTLSLAVRDELARLKLPVRHLDGDELRKKISKDLGFTKKDRLEHIRRVAGIAAEHTRRGSAVLVSLISPYRSARETARRQIGSFIEIYVHCALAVCEKRDVKGMYRLARAGKIKNFTGISDVYEAPLSSEITVDTAAADVKTCADKIMAYLRHRAFFS